MTLIKDPVTSNGARVGADGRLQTWSVIEGSEAAYAHDGDAYVAAIAQAGVRTLTLATGNTYELLYLQNDETAKLIVLDSLLVSADAAGLYLFVTKNPVVGTLANNTPIVPANRNFGSSDLASVTCEVWDEVGTAGITGFTGGDEIQSAILGAGPATFPLNSALHLGRGDGVLIGLQNPTGGGIEATAALRFHLENEDRLA